MAFLKIWIGAALAVVLFLTIQAIVEQQAQRIEQEITVHRT